MAKLLIKRGSPEGRVKSGRQPQPAAPRPDRQPATAPLAPKNQPHEEPHGSDRQQQ